MSHNPRSLFAVSLAIPYDKNHMLRLLGSLAAFAFAAVNTAILVFYTSTDTPVEVQSRFGLLLVVAVKGWRLTWVQLRTNLCNYAKDPNAFSQYEWRSLFAAAYGDLSRTQLCDDSLFYVILSIVCCVIAVASALGSVAMAVVTRLRGNPELRAQQHFDHCKTGMMVMAGCMVGIALPPVVFFFWLPNFILVQNTPLQLREGVFVGVIAALPLIAAIFGYHIDRSVLRSKLEFERLVWDSAAEAKRAPWPQMMMQADVLETAKFGGLVSPADLARQAMPSGEKQRDKFLYGNVGPWK